MVTQNAHRGDPTAELRHDGAVTEATQQTEATQPTEDGKPPENSAAFNQLLGYLSDPHRSEVAAQWEAVVQSKLGPEDRQKAEKMAPVVKAYLSREIEQDEYERRLAATTVPEP